MGLLQLIPLLYTISRGVATYLECPKVRCVDLGSSCDDTAEEVSICREGYKKVQDVRIQWTPKTRILLSSFGFTFCGGKSIRVDMN